MEELFDHILIGKALRHFIFPPFKTPDILGFENNLKEIVPLKLNELLQRTGFLKNKRDFELTIIKATVEKGSLGECFWTTLAFHEFSEYYVIQKWLNYWLSIWYKINPSDLPIKLSTKLNQIDDNDIQKSKQNPIQNFYVGQLRQISNKLVGLCPIHSEKTPSFNIYLATNIYHCYGCQAHGDSISFIQETKNLSFPEAVRFLL